MASMNEAIRFILGGSSSDEWGISLASGFGSTTRSINIESRTLITTKKAFGNIFNFHGIKYDSPLQFDIIIYNIDGSWINCYQERSLKKWLLKDKRQWFQVDQEDLADSQFYVVGVSAEIIDVGVYSGGMKITFETDSVNAWSGLRKKNYSTVNGSLTFNLNLMLDFSDYEILPNLIIKPTSVGTVKIKNNTTNETIELTNCVANETITIECGSDKISSSSGRLMINSWNKQTISLVENLNNVTLTGDFDLSMEYRLPIRVGA